MQKQTKPEPLGASMAKVILVVAIIVSLGAVLGVAGYVLTKQKCAVQNPPVAQKADETADWKTYRNEEYGFELQYPMKLTQSDTDKNPSDKFGVEFQYNCPANTIPALKMGIRTTVADNSNKLSITDWIARYENEEFFHRNMPDISKFADFSVNNYTGKRIKSLGLTYYKAGMIEDRVILPKDSKVVILDVFWDGQESVANSLRGGECLGEIKSTFDQILSTFKFIEK